MKKEFKIIYCRKEQKEKLQEYEELTVNAATAADAVLDFFADLEVSAEEEKELTARIALLRAVRTGTDWKMCAHILSDVLRYSDCCRTFQGVIVYDVWPVWIASVDEIK